MGLHSPQSCVLSLFMSYLSCPTISVALNKVFFGDSQNQTHIFLVVPTQSGVKQHEGLVKLQVREWNGWRHEEQGEGVGER